jgi:endonuclease/exonuclease/phosphatase family metal-dependent hydrolase
MLPPLLDVLSLNAWGLPWPLSRQRTRRFRRLARHFSTLPHHLVGVQEAWWPFGRPALHQLRVPGGWPDSGLALGGTLAGEVADLELLRFSRATGTDRLAGKGLLHGRLGALTVGVTHLQAGDAAAVRRTQIDELVRWLGAGPAVLLGDFNLEPGERAAEDALREGGFADVTPGAGWLPRNPFTRAAHPRRYDRVWVRGPFEVVRANVLCRVWSDHQPVHVILRSSV